MSGHGRREDHVVVFVNNRSGGGKGTKLSSKLCKLLPPSCVFDMSDSGPGPGLRQWKNSGLPFRILVCGGDGSVRWVFAEMDKLYSAGVSRPALAILPLGTGNDMARMLKWCGGSNRVACCSAIPAPVEALISDVCSARVVPLDRWLLEIFSSEDGGSRSLVFNHSFSVGVDAKIALRFHLLREAHPNLFPHRSVNKGWYAGFGLQALFSSENRLSASMTLKVDGEAITLPRNIESIIVLNVQSYGGGSDLWGKQKQEDENYQIASMSDGILEVVGITSPLHLVEIRAGLSKATKIAQGSRLEINAAEAGFFQADGEPWAQPPCRIVVSRYNSVNVLRKED